MPAAPLVDDATDVAALAAALGSARVEVDLDALVGNYQRLAELVSPARIGVVVKADAYGHGVRRVVLTLEAAGAHLAAVARVEEGVGLRQAGARLPVLVLGGVEPAQVPLFARHDLTACLFSREQLAVWTAALAGDGPEQPVHLKVDTGMSRLGFAPDEVSWALEVVRRHPRLVLAGFMSHFGDAELDSPRNPAQESRFDDLLELLTDDERRSALVHFANSAAGLHRPASRFDLVRFGIAIYGIDPAEKLTDLEPVMSLVAPVTQIREVEAGTAAGYGSRWVAERRSRLAVVPVGYGDGYPWRLSHGAEALVRGRRVPLAGAVSMDLTIVDVTGLEVTGAGAEVGDEVVLLGRQGGETITAGELAERSGTIRWEITCSLGLRLPRRYLQGGELVGVVSRHVDSDVDSNRAPNRTGSTP
ncbi:MAG TPA: alanine racemase [Thermoanaerobaculia bacterium]|nr:alanine racemase [Thermoanaerobaculia bacterium]